MEVIMKRRYLMFKYIFILVIGNSTVSSEYPLHGCILHCSAAVLQCSPCITIIAPGEEQRRLGWAEQDTGPGSSLTYWSLLLVRGCGLVTGERGN